MTPPSFSSLPPLAPGYSRPSSDLGDQHSYKTVELLQVSFLWTEGGSARRTEHTGITPCHTPPAAPQWNPSSQLMSPSLIGITSIPGCPGWRTRGHPNSSFSCTSCQSPPPHLLTPPSKKLRPYPGTLALQHSGSWSKGDHLSLGIHCQHTKSLS
jgi:hypothetical protein